MARVLKSYAADNYTLPRYARLLGGGNRPKGRVGSECGVLLARGMEASGSELAVAYTRDLHCVSS
jgi:hypothetical protein